MSTTRLKRARGFSLVAAVVILVVLTALAGFIVSVSNTQHLTQALDLMSSRAQQAARAGVEWGVYQVAKVPAGPFATACSGGTPTQTLSGLAGLDEFTIVVECLSNSTPYQEGSDPAYRVYQLTVTACNAASCPPAPLGPSYVEHRQEVRVMQ